MLDSVVGQDTVSWSVEKQLPMLSLLFLLCMCFGLGRLQPLVYLVKQAQQINVSRYINISSATIMEVGTICFGGALLLSFIETESKGVLTT